MADARATGTRQRLLDAARELFTAQGYADTAIEQVYEAAGVSRGALYHYFENKRHLFAALLEEVEAEVAQATAKAAATATTPAESLYVGSLAFLDLASDPTVRQIALIDAPSVLGWEEWRAVEARHAYGLIAAALQSQGGEGLDSELVEYQARGLLATLIELGLIVSRSDDPAHAKTLAGRTIRQLVDQLARPPTSTREPTEPERQ